MTGETDETILREAGSPETVSLLARLDRFADELSAAEPPTTRTIGEYELTDCLGAGGMGAVYRGRHRTLGHEVAVKLIRVESDGDERIARFYQEARAAASLTHPNLVAVHQVGCDGPDHFLVMDLVSGPTLAKRIADGPLSWREAAELMRAVAEGVSVLHQSGIVHRDLKPSNILLDGSGTPRVVDFGLAKLLDSADLRTHSGTLVGTPRYMSPELAAGRSREVGPASDLFSLGATLYELLTGQPAFAGSHPLESIRRVIESEPPAPRRLNRSIPTALQRICLKCLAKQPGNRYASAADLADDLRRVLAGEPPSVAVHQPTAAARREFRRSPDLWVRAAGIAGVIVTLSIANRLLPFDPVTHRRTILILLAWLVATVLLHVAYRRKLPERFGRAASLLPLLWGVVDVVAFTGLLLCTAHRQTTDYDSVGPLYVGYGVLIAASGFWLRRDAVWLTTALSCAGALGVSFWQTMGRQWAHFPLLLVVGLALIGLCTAQQVFRVRWISLADRGETEVK